MTIAGKPGKYADGQPLISVIMPTHNRAKLLGRAIQSVLSQTYQKIELLVVDDASTDGTTNVVRSFTDSRLRYIKLERNLRAAGARNVGIRSSAGELIAFQDDDDQWLVEKLEKQVAALLAAGDGVGLNLCGHIRFSPQGPEYLGGEAKFRSMDFSRGPLGGFGMIATPAWLVRRSYLEQVGLFDERVKSWDDWELALRLSAVCAFNHVDEPLLIQDRVEGGSMWKNERVFSSDMQLIMSKHQSLWSNRPDVLSRNFLLIGRCESTFVSVASGRPWLLKAIRHDPFNLRAWVILAIGFLGNRSMRSLISWIRIWRTRSQNR